MRRPNFFILGAPKCGTTSMAEWLGEHPGVFMSTPKEPTYFCTDLIPDRKREPADYERLFAAAESRHSVVGEASTGYLYSRTAVPAILEYSRDPRFLVMVRNPVEMAPAFHAEQLYQGNEHVAEFEDAWALQEQRAGEPPGAVKAGCKDPQFLLYGPFCRVGEQLARLYRIVGRSPVKVVLLDDVRRDPGREYRSVLRFLDLPDDGRREFPVLNASKTRKSRTLGRLTHAVGRIRVRVGPSYRGLGILNRLSDWNRESRPRRPLSDHMRATLGAYFRDDVELLAELLGRDLTSWNVADATE